MAILIIVAAGKGTRLGQITQYVPKPLVEIKDKKSILELALEEISKVKDIKEVILVTGYLTEKIEDKAKDFAKKFNIKITTTYNPYYDIAGNLHSLWMGNHFMNGKDDIFITNADNIIKSNVYKDMLKKEGTCYAVCVNNKLKTDDMKVSVEGKTIVSVSKLIQFRKGVYESVSLMKVPKEEVINFKDILTQMIKDINNWDAYWPSVVYEIYKKNRIVMPFLIKRELWQEIDYHGDIYEMLKEEFERKKNGRKKHIQNNHRIF